MISWRMATRRGAEVMQGQILENTAVEIDDSQLERGEEWTPRGFNQKASTGFPTQVRA